MYGTFLYRPPTRTAAPALPEFDYLFFPCERLTDSPKKQPDSVFLPIYLIHLPLIHALCY